DASGNMTNRQGQWYYSNPMRFDYDDLNRVTQVEQEGSSGGVSPHYRHPPLNATRNVTYNESPLNRQSVVSDNGFFEGYFADNGMNQYNNVGGVPVGYDGNFNLTNFNGG